MEFYQIYKPLTATPFASDESYMEIEPCQELKSYIRCFWGAKRPYKQEKTGVTYNGVVIPDTCMDIIFNINYSENRIENSFCGINDTAFQTKDTCNFAVVISTFGIRFYAWTAVLFSDESMKDIKNLQIDAEYYFFKLKREVEKLLFDVSDIKERISIVEKHLLKYILLKRKNNIVNASISEILQKRGNIRMSQLGKEIHTSNRQIERVFIEYVGISPKQFSSLIRYQYLWSAIVYKKTLNILDEVNLLGYSDQAHLLNDFKRFHTMTPSEAKSFAMKDVAFLQEI